MSINTRSLTALALALLCVFAFASVVSAGSPIVHKVNVGGPDACEDWGLKPGCDANLSLVATEYADGTVKGHQVDNFGHHVGGGHIDVTCVHVDGNHAWVGGVITRGYIRNPETGEIFDLVGFDTIIEVVDNGTSAYDTPDQISYTYIGLGIDCAAAPDELPLYEGYTLFNMSYGQVTVR